MRRRIAALAARPELWLGLLLTWTLLSALRSWHTPWARAAGTEALHWGAGIALALALGLGLRRVTGAAQALTVLLGGLVAAVLLEGAHADGLLVGPYGDHQLCASALLALLPVSLALSLAAPSPAWRWGAQIAAVAGALCLALTQTRSAWIGAGAAALVFLALWLRRPRPAPRLARRRAPLVPALLAVGVAGAGALLVAGTDFGPSLAARAQTLQSLQSVGRDTDWRAREQAWRGAAVMAAARPALGWGLGRYPGAQWAWTRTGRPLAPSQRPSLSEQAHDFYLQTLVETGAVGLALYLAALAALAVRYVQALRAHGPRPYGLREALLVAALSLLAGQSVDALASPSWQFPEVSLLFWAGLGLGLAAARPRRAAEIEAPLPRPAVRLLRLAAAGTSAVLLAAAALPVGLLSPVEAYMAPSGLNYTKTGSTLTPATTPAAVGQQTTYTMTAHYTNGKGTDYYANVTNDSTASYTAYLFVGGVQSSTLAASTFGAGANKNVLTVAAGDAGKTLGIVGSFQDTSTHTLNATVTVSPAT